MFIIINSNGRLPLSLFTRMKSHLKPRSVEGDVFDALDGAVVKDIRHEEQASYLFNCWGLKQVER